MTEELLQPFFDNNNWYNLIVHLWNKFIISESMKDLQPLTYVPISMICYVEYIYIAPNNIRRTIRTS